MTMPNMIFEEVGPQGWGVTNKLTTPPFSVPGAQHSNQGFALQAQFTRGGVHTLSFQLSPSLPDAGQYLLVRALAEVTWSVAGQSISRKAHVGTGTSISGVGEAVTVRLRDDTILVPDALEPYPPSYTYTAAILCTSGVRPPCSFPPYYAPASAQNFKYQAGDPETLIDIPFDAGVNSMYINPAGAIDDLSAVAVRGYPGVGRWDARSFGQWLPLIPGIRQIGIRNLLATDIYASVLFGIDG